MDKTCIIDYPDSLLRLERRLAEQYRPFIDAINALVKERASEFFLSAGWKAPDYWRSRAKRVGTSLAQLYGASINVEHVTLPNGQSVPLPSSASTAVEGALVHVRFSDDVHYHYRKTGGQWVLETRLGVDMAAPVEQPQVDQTRCSCDGDAKQVFISMAVGWVPVCTRCGKEKA